MYWFVFNSALNVLVCVQQFVKSNNKISSTRTTLNFVPLNQLQCKVTYTVDTFQ